MEFLISSFNGQLYITYKLLNTKLIVVIKIVVVKCAILKYNIGKISTFISEHDNNSLQLLVQALVLSRLDYVICNALLADLPGNSFKPLQLIQKSAARLIFNEPKRMYVTPLFINLHLQVANNKEEHRNTTNNKQRLLSVFKII